MSPVTKGNNTSVSDPDIKKLCIPNCEQRKIPNFCYVIDVEEWLSFDGVIILKGFSVDNYILHCGIAVLGVSSTPRVVSLNLRGGDWVQVSCQSSNQLVVPRASEVCRLWLRSILEGVSVAVCTALHANFELR